jgi:hypothetical protein
MGSQATSQEALQTFPPITDAGPHFSILDHNSEYTDHEAVQISVRLSF